MNSDITSFRVIEDEPDTTPSAEPRVEAAQHIVVPGDAVQYEIKDGNDTTVVDANAPSEHIQKAAEALFQLRLLRKLKKIQKHKKIRSAELKARVSKRRKKDKQEKASRKRNRRK